MQKWEVIYIINCISVITWTGDSNLCTGITGNWEAAFPVFFKGNTASHRDIHPTSERVVQISINSLVLCTACKCNCAYQSIIAVFICKLGCAHRIGRVSTCCYFKCICIYWFEMINTFIFPSPIKYKPIPVFKDKFIIKVKMVFIPSYAIVVSVTSTFLICVVVYKERRSFS